MIQDSNDIRQAANAVSILKTAILQSQAKQSIGLYVSNYNYRYTWNT